MPTAHHDFLSDIAFSANGKRIVSVGRDRIAIVWDVATGRALRAIDNFESADISAVALSPDGQYIAIGDGKGGLVVWDARVRKPLRELVWHLNRVTGVGFRNGASQLWSASADRTFVLWDLDSGRKLKLLLAKSAILGAAVSATEDVAATSEENGTASVWNLKSGKRIGDVLALSDDS